MAKCVDAVLQAFPDADKKDIEALHDAMQGARRDAFLDGITNPNSVFAEKAKAILEDYRQSVIMQKIKLLENVRKRTELESFVADPAFKSPAEGLRAAMAGTFKDVEGGRLSIDYRQKAMKQMLLQNLVDELGGDKPLMDIFKSGELDKEIMQEVEQLSMKKGKPGVSGSAEALEIGRAIHSSNQMQLKMLNDAGASIRSLDGYIMRQAHDAETIKAAGYEKWRNSILPLLDDEKTFKRDFYPIDPEKYLKQAYEDITDGKPKTIQGGDSDQVVKIIGTPANMAKRLETGRKLFFKDAESFYDYNQEFGKKTLNEQTYSTVTSTARSAALMETFGTNPRATYERLIAGMDKPTQTRLNNYYSELDGTTSMPGNSPMATYGANIRKVADMAKLGASMFSKFNELTARATVMHVNGENLLQAHFSSFRSFLESIPEEQRAATAHLTSVGAETRIGEMFNMFGSDDSKPGGMVKMHQAMMKATGLSFLTDANRSGTAAQLSAGLGMRANLGYSELPTALGRTLKSYDIGPVEWDAIRSQVRVGENGVNMVGYGDIRNAENNSLKTPLQKSGLIPDGASDRQVNQIIDKFKNDTSTKLATYYNDQVGIAVNEAGARERAEVLRRGTIADTPEGQAMRFLAQFKSYPVTMVTKYWDLVDKQVLAERQGIAAKAAAIAPLMVSLTMMGYLASAAKEMSLGKTPPDPSNPQTFFESAAKGGVLGIYGDYLLGEFDSRHGRSALSAIGGPVLGQFDDVADMYNQLKNSAEGQSKDKIKAATAFRFLMNNVPGSNLFYLRGALNYLFLNEIQETLNPGYMNRMKTRMKEQGQSFILGQ